MNLKKSNDTLINTQHLKFSVQDLKMCILSTTELKEFFIN